MRERVGGERESGGGRKSVRDSKQTASHNGLNHQKVPTMEFEMSERVNHVLRSAWPFVTPTSTRTTMT